MAPGPTGVPALGCKLIERLTILFVFFLKFIAALAGQFVLAISAGSFHAAALTDKGEVCLRVHMQAIW